MRLARRLTEKEAAEGRLRAAVDKLTVMNTELERFAFVAAHDLREPVRSVSNFATLLQKRCYDKLDDTEREHLHFLKTGAKRIYDMIGGLLTYSRIPSIAGVLHPVSATITCTAALENLTVLAEECGAEVTIGPLPQVMADEVLLVQLFQNLIGNAIKFRHSERPSRVEVEAHQDQDMWRFTVTDNGIGFDAGTSDPFELFRQFSPRGQRVGGGVGLAICKRIVQQLGGRIWAESIPGSGSTFGFSLPAIHDTTPNAQ